jgi:hypothetical protein
MKKLFLVLLLAVFAIASYAQDATLYANEPNTYISSTVDVTVTNTTAVEVYLEGQQHMPATQDYLCQLDSTSGDHTNVAVELYGQKFNTGAWAQIGSTVNWAGTTADTTIIISNATANRYRRYKAKFTGTGTGVTTIDSQEFKLYRE